MEDPTFFGCPLTKCTPGEVNGTRQLCPGPGRIPCPASGKCPGDSDPGSACPAWKRCQPGGCGGNNCGCPRSCPSHELHQWCVKAGYGKWISTTENCTEPSLAVCAGDAGALGWGTGEHAPPGPIELRSHDDVGLSVAEGGKCDRGGRCMCPASFMPSTGWIILWLLALLCVSVVSAVNVAIFPAETAGGN